MKKIITSLCYVSFIMCLLFVTSCDDDDKVELTGTLSGKVVDENQEALPDITVTLGELSTETNSEGYYKFTVLTSGTLILKVNIEGYEEVTKEINVEIGKDIEENISLVKETLTLDLRNLLSEKESEYKSNSENGYLYDDTWGLIYTSTFSDKTGKFVFNNFTADYLGEGDFNFSGGFTYTNKTDISNPESIAAITGKGVDGDTYLTAYIDDFNPTYMKFEENASYQIKGCYITNTTYTYLAIKNGYKQARAFEKDDHFKVTFIGKKDNNETGRIEYFLANDGNIVNTWEWVELSELGEIDELNFELESTDTMEYGGVVYSNTPSHFSLDGIKIVK